ncbi:hypothetical protein JTB14_036035 [Gonioctena quinquepunctata]|nr:hypothetical protein JTB14_036035 [Gonioctena quinquepunctata]
MQSVTSCPYTASRRANNTEKLEKKMSGNKCAYYNCGLSARNNPSLRLSHFPVKDTARCKRWILHSVCIPEKNTRDFLIFLSEQHYTPLGYNVYIAMLGTYIFFAKVNYYLDLPRQYLASPGNLCNYVVLSTTCHMLLELMLECLDSCFAVG